MKRILTINSGSSSFKFKMFNLPKEDVALDGIAERVGLSGSSFEMKLADGREFKEEMDIPTQEVAVQTLLDWLQKYHAVSDLSEIVGIGHRIVAGGEDFKDSALIDKEALKKVFALAEYAPLHNSAEGNGIKAFMKLLPNVPQVGVFDTSFHQSLDPVHYVYPIPYEYYKKYKIRKYGAHGTSVRYVSQVAANMLGKDIKDLKLIVAHLGSGASITAIKNGKSFDTSMGFTPLAGIMMGTRSGDIDPSVMQYVMNKENLSIDEMIKILNEKSGLLGISGVSSDMRDIEASSTDRAKLALEMFVNRIVNYVGAYITEMGGLDGIAFTAGIGEHDPDVRAAVMKSLQWLGLEPDLEANSHNGQRFISKEGSKVKAMIIPTDEELIIEQDVVRLAHLG